MKEPKRREATSIGGGPQGEHLVNRWQERGGRRGGLTT